MPYITVKTDATARAPADALLLLIQETVPAMRTRYRVVRGARGGTMSSM